VGGEDSSAISYNRDRTGDERARISGLRIFETAPRRRRCRETPRSRDGKGKHQQYHCRKPTLAADLPKIET